MHYINNTILHRIANISPADLVASVAKMLELRHKIAQAYFAATDSDKEPNFDKDTLSSIEYLNIQIKAALGLIDFENLPKT